MEVRHAGIHFEKVFLKGLYENMTRKYKYYVGNKIMQMMLPMEVTQDSVTPVFHCILTEICPSHDLKEIATSLPRLDRHCGDGQ